MRARRGAGARALPSAHRTPRPAALRRISRGTGPNIVVGAGFYLQDLHPPELAAMSAGVVAEQIVSEAIEGVDRIGLTGEVGVSSDFTPAGIVGMS